MDRVYEQFSAADLYFGHGTDNAWDESVFLVLDACGLPLDSGDDVLEATVNEPQWGNIVDAVRRRVEDRVPLPYIIGRAWFAGIEFRCDERALVPRSPIAELVQAHFDPWYGGTESSAQPGNYSTCVAVVVVSELQRPCICRHLKLFSPI